MSEQLKPCPFCGGEAELDSSFIEAVPPGSEETEWVICSGCGASTRVLSDSDDAVAAWNTRASQPALAQGDEAALIDSMCMTWRHDFGLDKLHGGVCAGMDDAARDGLRSQMRQLLNHHAGAIAALSAQREQPKGFGRTELSAESADWFEQNTSNPQPNQKLKEALERGRNVLESMQPQGVVVQGADDPVDIRREIIEAIEIDLENGRYKDAAKKIRALLGQREG